MLILTRTVRESIRIGDDVTITISAISGQQVKLAFNAPKSVIIMREELRKRDLEKVPAAEQNT